MPSIHISGRVVDGLTKELAKDVRTIGLRHVDPQVNSFLGPKEVPIVGGLFTVADVIPGRYVLTAYSGNKTASLPVEIRNVSVENSFLVLQPNPRFAGRVVIDGQHGNDLNLSRITVQFRGIRTYRKVVGEDGRFTLVVPAGRYTIDVLQLPRGAFLRSASIGTTELPTSEADINTSLTGELRLTIAPRSGSISVTVLGNDAKAVPGAIVVLVPGIDRRKRFDLYHDGVSDSHGHVQFQSVAPGEYSLFAWRNIEMNAWQNEEVLQGYESRAKIVRIEPDRSGSATITLVSDSARP
jgi:hypothetical protein